MSTPQGTRLNFTADGLARSEKDELDLNDLFARVFAGEAGDRALKYMRTITIEAVASPDARTEALFYLEGMRRLVSIVENRVMRGRNAPTTPTLRSVSRGG